MKKDNKQTRQNILAAANGLILTQGAEHLTLEAVAQAAGISKGGLLYHFPSKEALVAGLVVYLVDDFSADLARQLAQERAATGDAPGGWLRAFVKASFQPSQDVQSLDAGMMAASLTNPALLEPLRQKYAEWQAQAEQDGIDPAVATLVRLATDGLWLADLLNLAPPGGELREGVLAKLLELSGGKK